MRKSILETSSGRFVSHVAQNERQHMISRHNPILIATNVFGSCRVIDRCKRLSTAKPSPPMRTNPRLFYFRLSFSAYPHKTKLRSLSSAFLLLLFSLSNVYRKVWASCWYIQKKSREMRKTIEICITWRAFFQSRKPPKSFLLETYSKGYAIIIDLTFQFPHESNGFH